MRYAMLLLAATLVCVAAACGAGNGPEGNAADNAPTEAAPRNWDDQSDRNWRHNSQYKAHMRMLWVDCNRVVAAGRGDAEPTWHEIRAGAEDIARRADLIGGFWAEIDKQAAELLDCVEYDDRINATEAYKNMGAACDGCHHVTWPISYMHVTDGVVDRWLKNLPTHGQMEETDEVPPPLIPNRDSMKTLFFHYQMLELRLEQFKIEDVREQVDAVRKQAQPRAARWKTVGDNARTIAELSKKRKRDGMKEAYTSMTAACLACHGEQAGPMRPIMVPMPWDGPLK